jgi:phenylacetate-CoA ligase
MRRWLARRLWFPLQEAVKGHDTLRILREMQAADRLSIDELRAEQVRRLRAFIDSCYTHVPYVRMQMDRARLKPADVRQPADLAPLPLLRKSDIRSHRLELRSSRASRLQSSTTGGSTGEPLIFDIGRRRIASRVACRLRVSAWWDVTIGDSEVALWGSSIELGRQDRIRNMRDWLLATRLVSAFNMTDEAMSRCLDLIETRGCRQLFGYPSAIYLLCLHARKQRRDLRPVGIRAVFVTGEMLLPHQRETIAETFACQVADGYGGRDSGFIAHECPDGNMHLMSDAVIVEIVDAEGRPVAAGESGEIVVTDLYSEEAPFIRYATGDIATASARTCSCGRPYPLIERVEGRTNDLVVAPDGRLINSLALIYPVREVAGIEQYRIVQKTVDTFHVELACDGAFDRAAEDRIRGGWQRLLRAPVHVTFEYVPRIPPERGGKFRHVRSEVSAIAAANAAADASSISVGDHS